MKNLLLSAMLFVWITTMLHAQEFGISGELRPRFEARHGYKTLASPDDDAATFVSQRARVNLNYSSEKFKVFFSIQNVRVWGDVSTLSASDKNGVTFHEAYGQYFFNPKFSVKLGRQEIIYDDHRIFGSVGWAQQARSHDALILKFKTGDKGKLDVGFALNANGETLFDEPYAVNQYKSFQYAWYHTDLNEKLDLSLLFLNNGLPYDKVNGTEDTEQKTAYSQTIGARLTYHKGIFNIDGASYFQGGKSPNKLKNGKVDLSAYYFTINTRFHITNEFSIGAGGEFLSGNDQGSSSTKNNAFTPFYGTNHKFNGWMDYFYVGNHVGSVGLIDINAPIAYKKNKFSALLIPHFFSAQGDVLNTDNSKASSYLGTEVDMVVGYKLLKNVVFQIGYSQMFATETMEILKGGSKDETNNWAWAMITFKPNFFKTTIKK